MRRRGTWFVLAVCILAGACVREKEAPKSEKVTAPVRSPVAQPAVGAYDLEGKPRAKPRSTMGALEVDPKASPPAKRKDRDQPNR